MVQILGKRPPPGPPPVIYGPEMLGNVQECHKLYNKSGKTSYENATIYLNLLVDGRHCSSKSTFVQLVPDKLHVLSLRRNVICDHMTLRTIYETAVYCFVTTFTLVCNYF